MVRVKIDMSVLALQVKILPGDEETEEGWGVLRESNQSLLNITFLIEMLSVV